MGARFHGSADLGDSFRQRRQARGESSRNCCDMYLAAVQRLQRSFHKRVIHANGSYLDSSCWMPSLSTSSC